MMVRLGTTEQQVRKARKLPTSGEVNTAVPIPNVQSNSAHSYNLATVDTSLVYVAALTL